MRREVIHNTLNMQKLTCAIKFEYVTIRGRLEYPFHSPADTECISSIQIVAVTGNEDEAGFDSGNGNIVEFVTVNDQVYQVTMTGSVSRGSTYQRELEVVATGCLRVMEITEVHLLAFNDDGWLIASIDIGTRVGNEDYQLLTSDSDLNLWLDGNAKYEYPHDATDIKLTLANKCIVSIIIIALTGTRDNAGHLSSRGNHQLKVVLLNGTIIEDIPGDMYRRQQYKQEIPIVTTMCLGIRDISEVQLVGESGDGWFIAAFNTYRIASTSCLCNIHPSGRLCIQSD